jgi:integrase/recombinase XerD
MGVLLEEHLLWMETQNFSPDTVITRRQAIGYFIDWAVERGVEEPRDVTRPVLERYQRWMYLHLKANGQPLTFRTQNSRLRALRGYFRWLARQNYILHNPASELILPRLENRLPKYVLSVSEAERVLAGASCLRDRAMLELFYATGMRRMEVASLKLYDVDFDRGTLMVRLGKGKKDRHIPVSSRCLEWVGRFVREERSSYLVTADDGTVFLNDAGEPFPRHQVTALVRRYVRDSGIGKTGGCHLFRHTVATLMLENGADVRVIQEMLGHAKLSTTELYTRVSINLLKQVYAATHPGVVGVVPVAVVLEESLAAALELEAEEEEEE